MNLPDNSESSAAARLVATRRKLWHQQGEALLTMENARSFLNAAGLVLFASRPQIAAPAPSFVEAVLGAPNAAPTIAQIAAARELLARLVAEGVAVPLNLLGVGSVIGQAGDTPDFIASAQVFSYIFTLRGDKGWKQPPQATGAVRFSNLAIATHEALALRGATTAYDLVTELGKEVTEGAVLRALGELWSHLRVLPVLQQNGLATLWELATARLTKQVKAGANAGQHTALSALISLYLGQAIVATEDEVESFLSPLAARSRVRDVIHALIAARQLETIAIEGKTMLHVTGAALAFLNEEATASPAAMEETVKPHDSGGAQTTAGEAASETPPHGHIEPVDPGSRIAKFVPRKRAGAGDLTKARPAKFARKPFDEKRRSVGKGRPFAQRQSEGKRPPFGDVKGGKPFQKRSADRGGERGSESRQDGEKRGFRPKESEFKPGSARRERDQGRPERRPFPRREDSGERRTGGASFGRAAGRDRQRLFDRSGGAQQARGPFRPRNEEAGQRRMYRKAGRSDSRREFGPDRGSEGREFRPKPFDRSKPFRRPDRPGAEETGGPRRFGGGKPFAKSGGFGKPFRGKDRGQDRGRPPGDRRAPGDRGTGGFGAKFSAKKFGGARFGGKKSAGKPGGGRPFGKPKGRGKRKPPQGEQEA